MYGEPAPVDEAWVTYADRRCHCHREQLILRYYPLVKRVAGKMWRATPRQVDLDDLVSYGTLGLIRAVEHYDPYAGVVFETYAVSSIRGVMLDELRSLDWAPRSLRRRQREVDAAVEELERRYLREPTLAELAMHLNEVHNATQLAKWIAAGNPESEYEEENPWHEAEVREVRRQTDVSKPRSLDEPNDHDVSSSRYEYVQDHNHLYGLGDMELTAVWEAVASSRFTWQERLVLALYYFHNMTLAEVGQVAGIPESRASTIHTRLMVRLRESLVGELTA